MPSILEKNSHLARVFRGEKMLFYNFDLEKQTKKRIQSFTKLVALQKKIDFFQKKKAGSIKKVPKP